MDMVTTATDKGVARIQATQEEMGRAVRQEAEGLLDMLKLRRALLARELRTTEQNGEFKPVQLTVGGNAEAPQAMLLQDSPIGGWHEVIDRNRAVIEDQFDRLLALFLSKAGSGEALATRVRLLAAALDTERVGLYQESQVLSAEHGRTCAALKRQQEALTAGRRGILGTAVNLVKMARLFNMRESQSLNLESVTEAVSLLAWTADRTNLASTNAPRLRALLEAAENDLATTLSAGTTRAWEKRLLPDITLEHDLIARHLAERDTAAEGLALGLLLDPPDDLPALLAALREGAQRDAARQIALIDLEAAAELQRQVEDWGDPNTDPLVLVGQGVAAAAEAQLPTIKRDTGDPALDWGAQPGRTTVVQIYPGSDPLFKSEDANGAMRAARGRWSGAFALLTFVEEFELDDLPAFRNAHAQIEALRSRENNYLLEQMLRQQAAPKRSTPPANPHGTPAPGHTGNGVMPARDYQPDGYALSDSQANSDPYKPGKEA